MDLLLKFSFLFLFWQWEYTAIYPSQRQNLEILIQIFEHFQTFKILEKKWRRSFQAFVLTCNMHFIKKKTPIQCRHWATPNSKLRCKAGCTRRSADKSPASVTHSAQLARSSDSITTVPPPSRKPLSCNSQATLFVWQPEPLTTAELLF